MVGTSVPWGGFDVTVCLGDEEVTEQCKPLDTDAFDIVIRQICCAVILT